MEFVYVTECASLAACEWLGSGKKEHADQAAVTSIQQTFQSIECKGLVRIGEGRKDNAPGIFTGDRLGTWHADSLPVAIALDPIDGTTPMAKGLPGSISVLAVAMCDSPDGDPSHLFPAIPSHYMEKISVGPAVAACGHSIELDAPLESTLKTVADSLGKQVSELFAVVLDRPRNDRTIDLLRRLGCRIQLISDGDVIAAIAPSLPDSGIDIYIGIGGGPEAVLSATAVKCLGGQQLCRMWFKDDVECQTLLSKVDCVPNELSRIWNVGDMARGDFLLFTATGISDSSLLRGVRRLGQHLITHTMLMTSRNQNIRFINTHHQNRRGEANAGQVRCHAISY